MRAGSDIRIDSLAKGLNLRDSPEELAPGEAAFIRDYVPDGDGLKVRPGDASLVVGQAFGGETPGALLNGGDLWFVVTTATTRLFKIDPSTGTVTALGATATNFGGASPTMVRAPAIGGQGPYYFTTQVQMLQTDGTAAVAAWTAAAGTLPQASYMTSAGNRTWLACFPAYAGLSDPFSGVVWSDIGNPRSYPAANVTMFGPNDGERITGIFRLGDSVIVVKPSRAWLIYDLDTSANREIGFGMGSLGNSTFGAAWAMCETPAGLMGISPTRGLILTDGSSVKVVDDRILPVFDHWRQTQVSQWVRMVYLNDSVYMLAGRGPATYGQHIWEYSLKYKSWWRQGMLGTTDMGILTTTSAGRPVLFALDGAVGSWRLIRLFGGGATRGDGTALQPSWLSGLHDFGERTRKRMTSLYVDGDGPADTLVQVYDDYARATVTGQGLVTSGAGLLDSNVGVPPQRMSATAPRSRHMIGVDKATALTEITGRVLLRGRR